MKRIALFIASLMFASFLAGGCSTTQPCVGANCTRAEAYATIGEMRSQLTLLVDSNKIPAAKAEEARTDLRIAQTAVDSSTGIAGDDQLAKARGVLATLRTTLLTYGAKLK